ncbi:SO2930 family diheme c-type cytochrome [Terricaulis sp.]|uniref:SO2930 family diheme c-type cytochrome n=1 Tax=Terricaulis sp. TaxID=2768686 RepID=UPI003784A982
MTALLLLAVALVTNAAAQPAAPAVNDTAILAARPPETLAAYRLFRDAGAREPNARVTPYDLNTPLYSDGALKFRYVYIPEGAQAQYREDGVFEFPVGTVLIKTFAFAADMRQPQQNVRFLETRLIIRRADGWVAYPYVWNAEQTEARLSPIGATIPIDFTAEGGASQHLDWEVPNRNQCKGCHDLAGDLTPIGPTARNLNRTVDEIIVASSGGLQGSTIAGENQLATWTTRGLLADAPAARDIQHFAAAYDPASGTLAERARAYLHVNCAHCHNPQGPAHTSGLDLRWNASEPVQWGVYKRPVAAGRASAGYDFAIEPGHPERSFLISRMESVDPGVMMPELGRTLVDQRAVALMRDWVAAMDREGRTGNERHD